MPRSVAGRLPSPAASLDEREVPVRTDDHVVASHYPDKLGRGAQPLGEVMVGVTWGAVTGRMIVDVDDSVGALSDDSTQDIPR